MREPMAAPNTTKYSDVVITGATMLCATVRQNARHLEPENRPYAMTVERKTARRFMRASSFIFMHQADENILERALPGVQVA